MRRSSGNTRLGAINMLGPAGWSLKVLHFLWKSIIWSLWAVLDLTLHIRVSCIGCGPEYFCPGLDWCASCIFSLANQTRSWFFMHSWYLIWITVLPYISHRAVCEDYMVTATNAECYSSIADWYKVWIGYQTCYLPSAPSIIQVVGLNSKWLRTRFSERHETAHFLRTSERVLLCI